MRIVKLNNLSSQLMRHINKYLSYLDTKYLRLTCRAINADLKDDNDFVKIIRDRLKGRVPDVDVFIDSLIKYKHYITGSFLLQCMLGVTWENSDIDICMMGTKEIDEKDDDYYRKGSGTYSHEYHHYTDFMHDILLIKTKFYKEEEMKDMHWGDIRLDNARHAFHVATYTVTNLEGYPLFPVISRKYSIKNCEGIIDYIVIERYEDIFDFYNNTVDFGFCALVFDGRKLYIRNWNDVMYKTCWVDVDRINFLPDTSPGWSYQEPEADKYEHYIPRLNYRLKKYSNRGFNIKFVDEEMEERVRNYTYEDAYERRHRCMQTYFLGENGQTLQSAPYTEDDLEEEIESEITEEFDKLYEINKTRKSFHLL